MSEIEFKETDDGKKVIEVKPLFGLSSKGKTKTWIVTIIENEDGTAELVQKYGEYEGKLISNKKSFKTGKNIGKTSETTPFQQACKEAESKFKKKVSQEGYSEDKDKLAIPRLPMLAKNYKDMSHKVIFPCMVQIKLDGLRCFCEKIDEETVKFTSRKGLEFGTLSHLKPHLLEIMEVGQIFDGELYSKDISFQSITAAIKKKREDTLKIEFWIYDICNEKLDFEDRYKKYFSAIKVKSYEDVAAPVKAVESILVHNEEELYNAHDEFVTKGYEGLICRARTGGYEFKKRSDRLLKLKSFDDAEYLITGGYEGSGSAAGHVTFICVTETGQEFGCVPRGNHSYRASLWNNLDKIVAACTYINVRFFGLTDDGIPRFPVGLDFRSGTVNKNGIFEPDL